MTRTSWHTFTSAAPVFGQEDSYDPFYEPAFRDALSLGYNPAAAEAKARFVPSRGTRSPFREGNEHGNRPHRR